MRIKWEELNPVVTYANYLSCEPGFVFGPRIIYSHQLIYVVKGRGKANIQGRSYIAEEGDLFYYGPHAVHRFEADMQQPYELIGLHFDLIGNLEDAYTPIHVADVLDDRIGECENRLYIGDRGLDELTVPENAAVKGSELPDLLLQAVELYRRGGMMSAAINRSVVVQILYALHKQAQNGNAHLSPQQKVLFQLQTQLAKHADLPYDRSWIRMWTGYHEDYMARAFHARFGVSPHRYHFLQKIERAKELLAHTEISITELAETIHFGSVHYFSRAFKTVTSLSPSQFKRMRNML